MPSRRPTKLGRYEILEELGKGAMGVVYLAHDPLIGRSVALKTFRVGFLADDEEMEQFRVRFIREAQSAGMLNHPGIVTIHDVVEKSDEGLTFIAMEYVEGTDLKKLLRDRARLDLRTTVDIIGQLADALDYAHSKGVVHRDVKPANVILTNQGEVKITDFGIARVNASNLTLDGQMLGTPNYMAPEQIQGKEVDHRADLFSLGVVLYEALTGYKPFQGDNLTMVSHRIVHDHYTPYQDLVRGLPPGVDEVLARALAKEPAERYQTGGELAADLRLLILDSGVIEVSPPELSPGAHPEAPPREEAASGLNDTQDLSDSLPPPVPGPEALNQTLVSQPGVTEHDGDATRLAAGEPPPLPPPEPGRKPAKAPETEPRPAPATGPGAKLSRRRWLLVGIAAVLFLALAGSAVWYLAGAGERRATAERARERLAWNEDFAALLDAGQQALNAADRGAALAALDQATDRIEARRQGLQQALAEHRRRSETAAAREREADLEQLAMQEVTSEALRQQAEWSLEVATLARLEEEAVQQRLAAAREALAAGRAAAARAAAYGVLEIDPQNEAARRLATDAEAALVAGEQRRSRAAMVAPPPPPRPVPQPVLPPPEPVPAEPLPTTATLEVVLESEASRGVLIIYFKDQQLLREDFRFGGGGLFRRAEQGGTLRREATVDAGTATLKVFVTSKAGQPAVVRELTANFLGGSRRTLHIRVDREGGMQATLR